METPGSSTPSRRRAAAPAASALAAVLAVTVSAALSTALSGCGGGGSDTPPSTSAGNPQTPGAPTTPTTPTTPGTPTTPTTPPPTDPAPPDEITVTLADSFTALGLTTSTSVANWPAWTGTGQPVDGVNCLKNEDYHIHTLLSIYRNGTRLALPDAIGRSGCAYELHTHDSSGVIHIETDVPKKFMLRQFFALWGQAFTATNVAGLAGPYRYYLIENGKLTRYTGDPQALELTAYREIVILTGATPPTVLPKYRWTPGL